MANQLITDLPNNAQIWLQNGLEYAWLPQQGGTMIGWTPALNDNAHKKAYELLKSWLTPVQLEQYEGSGSFMVTGSLGNKYRINSTIAYGIDRLNEDGTTAFRMCIVPTDPEQECGYLDTLGDVMLSQKIALETDEMGALWIANHAPPNGFMWPGG